MSIDLTDEQRARLESHLSSVDKMGSGRPYSLDDESVETVRAVAAREAGTFRSADLDVDGFGTRDVGNCLERLDERGVVERVGTDDDGVLWRYVGESGGEDGGE